MRLTKHRTEILNLLTHSEEALSAAMVHASLPHINLVTIYRSLEGFAEAGTIKKLHLGDQEAYYEHQEDPHHHAICSECGEVIHFTLQDKELKQEFSIPGFVVHELEVTVHGICRRHLDKQPRAKTQKK